MRLASANWPGGVWLAGHTGLYLDMAAYQEHDCCGERQHASKQQGAAKHERQCASASQQEERAPDAARQ